MKRNNINTPLVIAAVAVVLILIAVLATCSSGDTDCDSAPAVTTLQEAALISAVDGRKPGKKPAPAKSKKPGRSVVGVTAGLGASHCDD